jgi:hypothetical protein
MIGVGLESQIWNFPLGARYASNDPRERGRLARLVLLPGGTQRARVRYSLEIARVLKLEKVSRGKKT